MDEVETAAADTTSDTSPSGYRPSHHEVEGLESPAAKRYKMDVFPSLHKGKATGLEGGGAGEGPGYRHYLGRGLPVGIAQPFRTQESSTPTQLEQESDQILKEEFDPKKSERTDSSLPSEGRDCQSDPVGGRSFENKHLRNVQKGGGQAEEEKGDSCDSDQSSVRTPRFNRFANESKHEDRENPPPSLDAESSGSGSSDDESSSSSNFNYPFAPPSTSTEGVADQHGREDSPVKVEAKTEEPTREPSSLHPDPVLPSLPPRMKYHVFVSHSTGDRQWARESIVVPLREPPHNLQVTACYHFMPDSRLYNDRAIRSCMADSCVVLVGLSPAYINSQR